MTEKKAMIQARKPTFKSCMRCLSVLYEREIYFFIIIENRVLIFCSHKCLSEFLDKKPEKEKEGTL